MLFVTLSHDHVTLALLLLNVNSERTPLEGLTLLWPILLMDHDEIVETSDSDERELTATEQSYPSNIQVDHHHEARGISTSPFPMPEGDWYVSSQQGYRVNRRSEEPPRKRIKVSHFCRLFVRLDI